MQTAHSERPIIIQFRSTAHFLPAKRRNGYFSSITRYNMGKSPFHKLVFSLVLMTGFFCNMQAQTPHPGFEHLTMEQGLSAQIVIDMLFDSKGYLWAATENGLDRYDGYSFTTYRFDPRDPHSINQSLTFSLFEDGEGTIWVGTAEGGINKFDRNTEKFINFKPAQPPNRFETVLRAVSAMNEDRQGMIWVGSYSGELRRFNKKTGQFSASDFDLGYHKRPIDLRPFDRITCIYKDKQNDLWIGNKMGLHKLVITLGRNGQPDSIHFLHYLNHSGDPNSLMGNEVTGITQDRSGNLWVATDSALNRMDKNPDRFVHYIHDQADPNSIDGPGLGKIAGDLDGNLWICTLQGVDRFNKERTRFEHFRLNANDLNSVRAHEKIVIDKAGNIWLGGDGIDKFDPRQASIITYLYDVKSNHSPQNEASALFESRSGILWFSTSSGLAGLDKKAGKFRYYQHNPSIPSSLSSDLISSALENEDGKLWISSWDGTLDLLDPKTGRATHYIGNNGRYKNAKRLFFNVLMKDSRGVLWIGATSGAVFAIDDKTGKRRDFIHDPADPGGLSDYQTNCLCEDREGMIWIGHGSVATDRLDPGTGKIKHYQFHPDDSNSISSNIVQEIFKDRNGNLWFGTGGGGLCRYHDSTDSFTSYTERNGLVDNSINSIVEDNKGDLWLGTGKGICRFSPSTETFTSFDFLNSSKSNLKYSFYFKGRDGRLYFNGRDEGVKAFDPDKIETNRYIPPVVITQIKLFNVPLPGKNEAKEIELTHDQNFFSFEFAALNYTNPAKNQYAYKLEGVDKDWVHSGTRRTANYTAVAPGTYTFRVKGSNNEGLWNNEGTSVKIIVLPPWWKTWWAYSLYALAILTALYFFDRFRKKSLIEKERELNKETELEMQALRAQMNPHFIFNCLSSINRFVLKNETEAASNYLTKFSKLIRIVLNNSKKPLIPLEAELEMLQLYLDMEKLRFKDNFSYFIDMDGNIDPATILIPPLLFQPFVENAVWHGLMHKTEPGILNITLSTENNVLICAIVDNGVGRAFAEVSGSKSVQNQKSMGIQITRQRLALINGKNDSEHNVFDIEDLYDDEGNASGTKVLLRIRYKEMTEDN